MRIAAAVAAGFVVVVAAAAVAATGAADDDVDVYLVLIDSNLSCLDRPERKHPVPLGRLAGLLGMTNAVVDMQPMLVRMPAVAFPDTPSILDCTQPVLLVAGTALNWCLLFSWCM